MKAKFQCIMLKGVDMGAFLLYNRMQYESYTVLVENQGDRGRVPIKIR